MVKKYANSKKDLCAFWTKSRKMRPWIGKMILPPIPHKKEKQQADNMPA